MKVTPPTGVGTSGEVTPPSPDKTGAYQSQVYRAPDKNLTVLSSIATFSSANTAGAVVGFGVGHAVFESVTVLNSTVDATNTAMASNPLTVGSGGGPGFILLSGTAITLHWADVAEVQVSYIGTSLTGTQKLTACLIASGRRLPYVVEAGGA